jgi:hypothetical protein
MALEFTDTHEGHVKVCEIDTIIGKMYYIAKTKCDMT